MSKWYQDQPMIMVEYPPYWLKFTLGVLRQVHIQNDKEVELLTARIKETASTYIQDRDLLGSLRCEFHTEDNGAIYKAILC